MNEKIENCGWREAVYFGTDGRWHGSHGSEPSSYDAVRDAYEEGYGPAVTRRQIEEDRAWQEA